MQFYTSGDWFAYLPPELRSLPLDLMRTHTFPRDPEIIGRAIEQYHRGEPDPIMMPGRMKYQRWKKTPYMSAWGQNAVGMLEALRVGNEQRRTLAAGSIEGLPVETELEASDRLRAVYLPMPTDNMNPHLVRDYVPLAREALPISDIPEPEALDDWAQQASNPEDMKNVARSQAMKSVDQLQARYTEMLQGTTGPWFMR